MSDVSSVIYEIVKIILNLNKKNENQIFEYDYNKKQPKLSYIQFAFL